MRVKDEGMRPRHDGQEPSFVQVFSPLLRSGIPPDELHVYLLLCDHAGREDYCWPSDRTLGGFIGKSRYTVQRILERLEVRKLITRTAVEVTPENPTGRVITVHKRVRPRVAPTQHRDKSPRVARAQQGVYQGRDRGVAGRPAPPVAPAPHELHQDKKQHGPATGGEGPPARREAEDRARDALLRAAWAGLSEARRAEVTAAVKAENPGLARWPAMLEPLCLVEMESRLSRDAALEPGGEVPPRGPAEPA